VYDIYIYAIYISIPGFFCDGTRRYSVPGNENKECILCMLALQYHIINHGVPAPSGTFSKERVRMYKNPVNNY